MWSSQLTNLLQWPSLTKDKQSGPIRVFSHLYSCKKKKETGCIKTKFWLNTQEHNKFIASHRSRDLPHLFKRFTVSPQSSVLLFSFNVSLLCHNSQCVTSDFVSLFTLWHKCVFFLHSKFLPLFISEVTVAQLWNLDQNLFLKNLIFFNSKLNSQKLEFNRLPLNGLRLEWLK